MTIYAHSVPGRPLEEWETLSDHLDAVASKASDSAAWFGWSSAARVAGQLHDIGKCSPQFQAYIRALDQAGASGGDHSTAGARAAVARYSQLGRLLAYGIAGHHAGLADSADLDRRIGVSVAMPAGWEVFAGALPPEQELLPARSPQAGGRRGFMQAFLARMLFSCLVDADHLQTDRFYRASAGDTALPSPYRSLDELAARLHASMARIAEKAALSPLNRLRTEVLAYAMGKAFLAPGLFTLTVPTGGGKTLTSLSFALEHARRQGLRRIVYVIPFTSIIEQTAEVFRRVLDTGDGPDRWPQHVFGLAPLHMLYNHEAFLIEVG